MTALFRPRSHLLAILQAVQAEGYMTEDGQVFSLRQVCCGLKHYIKCRRLYDPLQPWLVHCLGDPLTLALGVKSFTLDSVIQVVLSQLERVCDNSSGDGVARRSALAPGRARSTTTVSTSCVRKKRRRSPSLSSSCEFDQTADACKSREHGDTMETTGSISDDVTDDVPDPANDSSSGDDSEEENEVTSSLSDVQAAGDCWADGETCESDDDPDTVTEISWLCEGCGLATEQSHDNCWWCHRRRSSSQQNSQPQQRPSPSPESTELNVVCDASITAHFPSCFDSGLGSSQESSSSQTPQCDWPLNGNSMVTPLHSPIQIKKKRRTVLMPASDSSAHLLNNTPGDDSACCIICLTGVKDASIVHGRTGHQITCYACAKKLRRHGQPCPVCRRPIARIVRNYVI